MLLSYCLKKEVLLPLLLFPATNLVIGFTVPQANAFADYSSIVFWQELLLLAAVACAEELFFRGLLLRELVWGYGCKPLTAAIAISVLFGGLHLLNVFSYATFSYAAVQAFCAFTVGFNLSALYCTFRHIGMCVLLHALINITSLGLDYALTNFEIAIFMLVATLYLLQGIWLLKSREIKA